MLKDVTWWKAAGVRAIKTFAQTMLATLTLGVPFTEMEWFHAVSIAAGASVVSLLTSLAGLPEYGTESGGEDNVTDTAELNTD